MQEQVQLNTTFPERVYEIASERGVGVPVKAYYLPIFWLLLLCSVWIAFFAIFLPWDIHTYMVDKADAQRSTQFFDSCQTCTQADKDESSQFNASLVSDAVKGIREDVIQIVAGLLIMALFLYFRKKFPLYRCSEGLLLFFVDTKRRVLALRWDEIAEVYWKADRIRSLRKAGDKQELDLMRFRDSQDIRECIEHKVTPRLFAQALEQYNKPGNVLFGCLTIGHEGLAMNSPAVTWSIDECFVRWQDLEDIRFADGVLSIKRKGEWKRWDGSPRVQKRLVSVIPNIPNPMVYAALVKYLLENSHVEEKKLGE